MSIMVGDNFSYKGSKPLDARTKFATVAEMVATPVADLYDGCEAYVTATKKYYSYDSTNEVDETLGKWRERQSGGSGTTDYPDLDNKPQIEGVTLIGNKTASDLGLVTKAVNDLINYYLKSDTYSKTEVDTIVTAIKNSRFEVVATLPTSDIKTNVIYLVPKADAESGDVKDEYINLDGTTAGWEKIGSTEVDLSGYATLDDLNTALADYTTTTDLTALLANKQNVLTAGDGISIDNDEISIDPMPAEDMDDVIDELPTGGNIAVTGYVPLGTLIPYYGETAPDFFLACDGSTYNKADYPELAKHLLSLTNNTPYIVDGDDTKFKVPDLRGEFIRGAGTNSHTNQGSGAGVGEHQDGTEFPRFSGNATAFAMSNVVNDKGSQKQDAGINVSGASGTGRNVTWNGSWADTTSSRFTAKPTNTSVLFCIAYKDIYSNPMNDYSTDEKVVGTWINGKTLYQKTVELGALPNATTKTVAHNISNLGIVVSFTGVAYNSSGQYIPLNFPSESNVANSVTFRIMSTNLQVMAGIDRSSFTGYVTLQYTKTTD